MYVQWSYLKRKENFIEKIFELYSRKKETAEAKLPTSADDILNMNNQYKHLDSGELFLLRAERDFGRNILKNSETFSTVPRDFSQIYVVFASSHDKLFPLFY